MVQGAKFKIDAEDFTNALKSFPRRSKKLLKDGLEEVGANMVAESIKNCPRAGWPLKNPVIPYGSYPITGNLRRSIRFKVKSWKKGVLYAGGSMAPYAKYVHNGTVKLIPRPFLIKGIEKSHRLNIAVLTSKVRESILGSDTR